MATAHRNTATVAGRSGAYAAPPLVLIVEDNDDLRGIYAEYLRFDGFRVEQADNGRSAIEKAVAIGPDVLVLDFHMPVMDGIEAARRLKANPATSGIPLILLTSCVVTGGATYFEHRLEKPCPPEDVATAVRAVLERAERPSNASA